MSEPTQLEGKLRRGLKKRHLIMIALGGAIADGLFLATGQTLTYGGSGGVLIAFSVIAVMVYFMITSLGEMATYLPVSGSFQTYCTKYISPSFGFAIGWNYWFSWAIVIAIELVASSILMAYWFPTVSPFVWCILFVLIILVLNLLSANVYGESEYWFASIKVFAVIAFIVVGILMILGLVGNPPAPGMTNFTANGGLFPRGFLGILLAANTAIYAFLGSELVGIAAGESADPSKSVPKATRTVFWRLVLFYMCAIFVMAAILPWKDANVLTSPFTKIFEYAGIPYAATLMNIVVMTAILSSANSGLYACSRMVYAMAQEGKAPKVFCYTNRRGIPVPAVILTVSMGLFAFILKYVGTGNAYLILVSASSLATIFSWIGIAVSHYRFRKIFIRTGHSLSELKYKAVLYPFGPIFTAVICILGIVGTYLNTSTRMTAVLSVPVFFIVWLIGFFMQKRGKLSVPTDEELRAQAVEIYNQGLVEIS